MSIFLIVGTRPQIIKSIPIIKEAKKNNLEIDIIHTGQHYDYSLSQLFFEEFGSPQPLVNFNVGSGSHVYQTAEIMVHLEKMLFARKPSLILIPGDTNSALAGALASVKLGFPVAHVESGARSYDMTMAEEINRRIIDHCATILFAPTSVCKKNLENESVLGQIYQTGDTMYDAFIMFERRVGKSDILHKLDLITKEFAVLTTHRAENVDNIARLKQILKAMKNVQMPIIFPVHPRTKEKIKENDISLAESNVRTIDPIGYIEMLALVKHSKVVVTDSGGLQKEAFWSKTPCITIRDRTEWVETAELGVNFITNTDSEEISRVAKYITNSYDEIKGKFKCNPFGNGYASKKIVQILKDSVSL